MLCIHHLCYFGTLSFFFLAASDWLAFIISAFYRLFFTLDPPFSIIPLVLVNPLSYWLCYFRSFECTTCNRLDDWKVQVSLAGNDTGNSATSFWEGYWSERNPCSLAAQIALLQESNVPTACEGLDFGSFPMLTERIRNWGQEYGVLQLGYWRNNGRPEKLFHCIRILSCSQGNFESFRPTCSI